MTSPRQIRHLCLVLTARCNLRCSYCYQNAKKSLNMTWETIRASLELILDSHHREVELAFVGGEPLLEFSSVRRAVEYFEENRPPDKRVKYSISTNGTLLTEEVASFLAEHRFNTQLSFDGISDAQDYRGEGTFKILDRLLDRLRREREDFFRRDLAISLTLIPPTIIHLADSVDYFLEKGVQKISIFPAITSNPTWQDEHIEELDAQFDRILESSLNHCRRTSELPLPVFRHKYDNSTCSPRARAMCGVVKGEGLTVDVDGQAYGCAVFANSYQHFHSQFLRRRLDTMRMGRIDDPEFPKRYASFPEAARRSGLFHHKENKYSSYRRCGECSYITHCSVCPVSIGHIPENSDPDRVSDFCCAYNLVALKYRDRFPSQPNPLNLIRGPAEVHDERRRWKALAEALKETGSIGTARRDAHTRTSAG